MTNDELKIGLKEHQNVVVTLSDGISISGYINAIRYTTDRKGEIMVSVEIVTQPNSLIIADPKNIERK